ncbi:PEP-CTERM sorting domain-containing protein [Rubripirellula amarantea]|nr:PEP-CTERM sorting domain-containing protein [Rubripirellula amarantea]
MLHTVVARAAFVASFCVLAPIANTCHAAIVTILPIQVGNGSGDFGNPGQELFLQATNKIWSQAGITFNYLPFTSIISADYYDLDDQNEVDSLFANAPGASLDAKTISMWFVNDHYDAYGEVNEVGGLNANKIVISNFVFDETRLDTIAHEVGHLLGLNHDDPGVETNFLMRSGDDRIAPTVIGNIFPDGTGLDRMTAGQVAIALADAKVSAVPEPSSVILVAGCVGFAFLRRRQMQTSCRG